MALLVPWLLVSCFQAQLHGPVGGALIEVAALRDPTALLEVAETNSRESLIAVLGEEKWEALGALQRLWLLGVFRLDEAALVDEALYLVTARGGADADRDSDGLEDATYSPVTGSWRAVMTGKQLRSLGPKVSTLTDAVYQWLAEDIAELSDRQIRYNLDLAADSLVDDVAGDPAVNYTDLLFWSRQLHAGQLRVPLAAVDALAESVAAGEDEPGRRGAARALVALEIERGVPPGLDAAQTLEEQLFGLDFDLFLERSYEALQLRFPESIVELGLEADYPELPVLLNDASDEYARETYAVVRVILESLLSYDAAVLTATQRESRDVYQWYLEDWLAGEPWLLYSYPASAFINSVPRQTEFFFSDVQPLETAFDARDYVTRLAQVGRKLNQARDGVLSRARAGIVEPAITLEVAADALRFTARTRATSTSYYTRLRDALPLIDNLPAAESADLLADAKIIIETELQPAYESLRQVLLELLPDAPQAIGVGQFPDGRSYYRYALRHYTTTPMTAGEIHELGLAEVARVTAEIRQAAAGLDYSASLGLQPLFERIGQDGGVLVGDEILAGYSAILADATVRAQALFEDLPSQELVVLGGTRSGFYLPGAEDGSRPGAFYAGTTGEEASYAMPSLAYHEGIPGHHLQIALARELELPDFRRLISFTGFSEGWALYAERLAAEEGWYENDPLGDLGRLQFELIRAVRLVVDTGIHHYGWNWDEAVDYYAVNAGTTLGFAQGAVARFLRWPGQATAYMTGMKLLLDLRARYAERQGDDFDIRRFHSLVLGGGSMPLELLETRVLGN